jgi:hypothetical protein
MSAWAGGLTTLCCVSTLSCEKAVPLRTTQSKAIAQFPDDVQTAIDFAKRARALFGSDRVRPLPKIRAEGRPYFAFAPQGDGSIVSLAKSLDVMSNIEREAAGVTALDLDVQCVFRIRLEKLDPGFKLTFSDAAGCRDQKGHSYIPFPELWPHNRDILLRALNEAGFMVSADPISAKEYAPDQRQGYLDTSLLMLGDVEIDRR